MFKIIKNTKYYLIFSSVLMVLSIVLLSTLGLRLGIDYKGGTVIEVQSSDEEILIKTESVLNENAFTDFQIKESSNDKVSVRMPAITTEQHRIITQNLTEKMPDVIETQYDTVGPTISRDLLRKSIIAVVLASLGIIIYIAFAFRRIPRPLSSWKFGASAAIALIHDLVITTGLISLLGYYFHWIEVDALFVTALLTIMGFSVHDTIVVYDRLRENFIKNPHQNIGKTAEESVNQTLARSINTSLTVIIVLLTLFLMGGESIRHFVLTLLIGTVFGTYSSIFVATAILVIWHKGTKKLA